MRNGSSVQVGSFQASVVTQIVISPHHFRRKIILESSSHENKQTKKKLE